MPIWQITLLSLGLDLLAPLMLNGWLPLPSAFEISWLCALLILPAIDQRRVQRSISRLRTAHKARIAASSSTIPLAILAVVFVIFAGKSLLLLGSSGIIPIVVTLIMLGLASKHALHAYREGLADRETLKSNAWAHVQRWENQLLIISLLPILLARAISLCGVIAYVPTEQSPLRWIFIGVSLILLLILRPQRGFFISHCSRCKQSVPIAFAELGSCMSCDQDLRDKYLASMQR